MENKYLKITMTCILYVCTKVNPDRNTLCAVPVKIYESHVLFLILDLIWTYLPVLTLQWVFQKV